MRGRRFFRWSALVLAAGLILIAVSPAAATSRSASLAASSPLSTPRQESAAPAAPAADPAAPTGDVPGATGESTGQAGAATLPANKHPGIYAARDNANLNPTAYHIVGSHQAFYWSDLEPSEGNYNWSSLDDFVTSRYALGKPVGIGIMTYLGRADQYNNNQDPIRVPAWVTVLDPNATVQCSTTYDGRYGVKTLVGHIPNYKNSTYQTKYANFVQALANHIRYTAAVNQAVEFVYMGVGAYGESQPCDDQDDQCLVAAGLGQWDWTPIVNHMTDVYKAAFQPAGGGFYKPLMLLSWPTYRSDRSEAAGFRSYAIQNGVGLAPAGAFADIDYVDLRNYNGGTSWYGRGAFDHILGQAQQDAFYQANFGQTFPVAFETYDYMATDADQLWWALAGTLNRHADYITVERNVLYDGEPDNPGPLKTGYAEPLDFANKYLGKNLSNTPGVWVALREAGCPDSLYPEKGNYSMWLTQDNAISGGATKAVSGMSAPIKYACPTSPNPRITFNEAALVGVSGPGSFICRRTDQATSNPRMYFKVDDGYINGGSNVITIRVRYLDYGTDTWTLKYDGVTAREQTAGTITKTNTHTWKWYTFNIPDARMANGAPSSTDFYIDCNSDGNEYLNFIEVAKQAQSQTFQITLAQGANLISLPLTPASSATTSVFNPIWSIFDKVYAYDINGAWKSYVKGRAINSLTTVDTTMGLWLYVTSAGTYTASGTTIGQSSIALKGPNFGNIVGYPSLNEKTLATAFGSIWSSVAKVYEFSPTGQTSYVRGRPINTLTTLKPGRGYVVYVDANCTWTVNP